MIPFHAKHYEDALTKHSTQYCKENGFTSFKTVQVDTPGTYDEFHMAEKQLSVAILTPHIFYKTRQIQFNRHDGHLS